MVTGSDQERHLAGCSALFSGSQESCLDPSAPGLRQAAFWVYVRQCLYNACVYLVTPNVNLKHVLLEIPAASDHLSELRSETGWANRATWMCANVVDFAFGSDKQEQSQRLQRWRELSFAVEDWRARGPATFEPLFAYEAGDSPDTPFPERLFTADHHGNRSTSESECDVHSSPLVMAFGFYHLACMLLVAYKPAARFAIRRVKEGLSGDDVSKQSSHEWLV